MASSQAANLTGLLSSIGSTIGEMGGPGNALIDNVRTLNAPKLDQNDPASMRAYADWAMRNGDRQTAQQYQLAAGKMEQEQGARKASVDMQQMQETLRQQQEKRDAALLNATDDQSKLRVNQAFDNAQETLVGRMNELSGQYGLESTGTGALQQEQQKREVITALNAELANASDDEAATIKRLIAGVSTGAISPSEAIDSAGSSMSGGSKSFGDARELAAIDENNSAVARGLNKPVSELEIGDSWTDPETGKTYTFDKTALNYRTDVGGNTNPDSVRILKEAGSYGAAVGGQKAEDMEAAFQRQQTMADMSTNYGRAIELLETEGATSGVIASMVPSVTAATLELENIRNEMGLDVVGMSNFGQLNESELKLALSTAMPDLTPEALIPWLKRKQAVTNKIIGEMNRYRTWASMQKGGGTLEEFNRTQQAEEYRIDFDAMTDPSGKESTFDQYWEDAE